MDSSGAKAGLLSGAIYGAVLATITAYSIYSVPYDEFERLIAPYLQGNPELARFAYTLALYASPPIVFVYALLICVIFGLVYGWISERSAGEWKPLFAILVGLAAGFLLSITINVPVPRLTILAASPSYFVPLFILYRRSILAFDPSWLASLSPMDKRAMKTIGRRKKVKLIELSDELGVESAELKEALNMLEEKGYVGIDYENRYFLTEKGRLCVKEIT